MKSMQFEGVNLDIVTDVCREVCEFHHDYRKHISQSKYVIEVPEGSEYFCTIVLDYRPVPIELVGFWMMDHADDLRYTNLQEALKTYSWVKCFEKEIVTTEWVPIDE